MHDQRLKYNVLEDNFIRVLELQPGEFSDELRGTLIDYSLDDPKIEYNALSYVWGRFYPGCYINIDDSVLQIHGSLDDALRHLRQKDRPIHLWADAICINQENVAERSHQVALMMDVYQKAKTVNIWLGLSNERSNVGLEILSFLAGAADLRHNPPWKRLPPELARAGLSDIIHRQYFRRLWVVQEVAVAQRLCVFVGKQNFGWSSQDSIRFLNRLKLTEISPLWESAGLMTVDMTPLIEIVELAATRLHGMRPLVGSLDVIYNMRHRTASDPRDMIFGLHGLANHEPAFKVDYSLSKEDVYSRLLEHVENIHGDIPQESQSPSTARLCPVESCLNPETHLQKGDILSL
jgi:Heterokaryon incompatibility protein (HET)